MADPIRVSMVFEVSTRIGTSWVSVVSREDVVGGSDSDYYCGFEERSSTVLVFKNQNV